MRTIKFRGKRVDNGEWVYGDLLRLTDGDRMMTYIYYQGEVIPETVGQFTGLCDKNGKEIYEGDIVIDHAEYHRFHKPYYVVNFSTEDVGSCGCCYPEFSGSGFVAEETNHPFFADLADEGNIEIVGNIHDNKELLED